ncbi:MAG: DNA-protecting protein DprA [Erysipelotrichaceae bacterium]|nr:DNA-protecting protein DprA [Erysipelotrichaceae bacterium]
MERELLISYALFYGGEYMAIRKAILEQRPVLNRHIENALTIFDPEYPIELRDLRYPPYVLFYKGDLTLLKEEKIAIVGSRKPCDYALKATECLCKGNTDKVIISGLAKGIDAKAHWSASKTIAISGCGIDRIYPFENAGLYEEIEKNGLILSEYPGMIRPYAYHFPFRNRIIAALASKIYIMQSADRSGTMTTVNEGLELGRSIKVLPYDLFDSNGISNNRLIYEGAEPILSEEIAI